MLLYTSMERCNNLYCIERDRADSCTERKMDWSLTVHQLDYFVPPPILFKLHCYTLPSLHAFFPPSSLSLISIFSLSPCAPILKQNHSSAYTPTHRHTFTCGHPCTDTHPLALSVHLTGFIVTIVLKKQYDQNQFMK